MRKSCNVWTYPVWNVVPATCFSFLLKLFFFVSFLIRVFNTFKFPKSFSIDETSWYVRLMYAYQVSIAQIVARMTWMRAHEIFNWYQILTRPCFMHKRKRNKKYSVWSYPGKKPFRLLHALSFITTTIISCKFRVGPKICFYLWYIAVSHHLGIWHTTCISRDIDSLESHVPVCKIVWYDIEIARVSQAKDLNDTFFSSKRLFT